MKRLLSWIQADVPNLVVSEIMYHPSLENGGGEFIELMNVSQTEEINLTSVRFDNGISFEFPVDFTLGPGKRAVIASTLMLYVLTGLILK